jgi:hypothetical protein
LFMPWPYQSCHALAWDTHLLIDLEHERLPCCICHGFHRTSMVGPQRLWLGLMGSSDKQDDALTQGEHGEALI